MKRSTTSSEGPRGHPETVARHVGSRLGGLAILLASALVLLVGVSAAAYLSVAVAATPVPSNFFTVTDSGGANDVNSEQNDLTQMGRDDSDPAIYKLFWSWDTTNFTAQAGNGCALFDTDGDTNINFAVCAEIENVPSGDTSVVKQTSISPVVVSCSDAKDDRCTQPSDPLSFTSEDVKSGNLATLAASPPANLVTDTDPFDDLIPDQTHPYDSTIGFEILKSFLPEGAVLVNVCTYPSLGNRGNNNPFDCVVTPGGGYLVISKDVPEGAGGSFDFTLNPGAKTYTLAGDSSTAAIPLPVGSGYSVAETVPAPWVLDSATCTIQGGGSTGTLTGSTISGIEIQSGKTTTCTFTDSRDQGYLKLSKVFEPLASGFDGDFAVVYNCGAGDETVTLAAGASTTVGPFDTGTSCTVSEPVLPTAPDGWTFGSPGIVGSPATVIKGDEAAAVAVTVTNTISRDLGNLEVLKTLANPDGADVPAVFLVDYDCGEGFTGLVEVGPGAPATVAGIPTGNMCTVSEVAPAAVPGYSWGEITYMPDSPIEIAEQGETYSITVGNSITRDLGTLVVKKLVVNDNGGTKVATDFSFEVGTADPVVFKQDGSDVSKGLNTLVRDAGTFAVTEPAVAGYTTTYDGCEGTLARDETKTCTITNDDLAPVLHLRKTVANDNGRAAVAVDWTLSATGTVAAPTNLSGKTPVDSGAGFKADTYLLAESGGPAGYTAGAWQCTGGTQDGNKITVGLGRDVTCAIDNNDDPLPPPPPPSPPPPPPPLPTPQIDLSIVKIDKPDPVFVGTQLTYTLSVRNAGPDAATNVTVADSLPFEAKFVSVKTDQGTCTGGQVVRCNLGSIAPNGRVSITIVVRPQQTGTMLNSATVVGDEPEPNTADNRASAPTLVRGVFKPPVLTCPLLTVQPRSVSQGRQTLIKVLVTRAGKAVPGVRILVTGPGLRKGATTDSRGRVAITVRPPKAGIVTVRMANQPARCSTRRVGVVGVFQPPPVTG